MFFSLGWIFFLLLLTWSPVGTFTGINSEIVVKLSCQQQCFLGDFSLYAILSPWGLNFSCVQLFGMKFWYIQHWLMELQISLIQFAEKSNAIYRLFWLIYFENIKYQMYCGEYSNSVSYSLLFGLKWWNEDGLMTRQNGGGPMGGISICWILTYSKDIPQQILFLRLW